MIYEWMEGGFFLIQHVDLGQEGTSTEVIGHERGFEAEREDKVSLLLQYGRHLDVEGGGRTCTTAVFTDGHKLQTARH